MNNIKMKYYKPNNDINKNNKKNKFQNLKN